MQKLEIEDKKGEKIDLFKKNLKHVFISMSQYCELCYKELNILAFGQVQ